MKKIIFLMLFASKMIAQHTFLVDANCNGVAACRLNLLSVDTEKPFSDSCISVGDSIFLSDGGAIFAMYVSAVENPAPEIGTIEIVVLPVSLSGRFWAVSLSRGEKGNVNSLPDYVRSTFSTYFGLKEIRDTQKLSRFTGAASNSSTTTVALPAELNIVVEAGDTYYFEIWLAFNAATTTGLKISLPASNLGEVFTSFKPSMGSTTQGDPGFFGYGWEETASSANSTNSNVATITGYLTCTTSGTLQYFFGSEVAGSAITITNGLAFLKKI